MRPTPFRSLVRGALATLALPAAAALSLGLAALLARHVAVLIDALSPATSVDELVVLAASSFGVALALWLGSHLVIAAVCAIGAAVGRRWRAGERLVAAHGPGLVRRGLALAVGASVGLGGVAIAAAETGAPPDLGWVPTAGLLAPAATSEADTGKGSSGDDEADDGKADPTDPASSESASSESASTQPESPRVLEVEPGDSLWSLTEEFLDSPGDSKVATAWPELYEANRDLIGADPDLIHPGQELVVPAILEEQP